MPHDATFTTSNGYIVTIDRDDRGLVLTYRWHARYCKPSMYVCRTKRTGNSWNNIYLHRFLLNCPANMQVDHINCDTLDNRRSNLEIVTPGENLRRRRFK
jgi:hypothetical protein